MKELNLTVVSGSHRNNSESERIGAIITSKLKAFGTNAKLLTLAGNPIPLWDQEELKNQESDLSLSWNSWKSDLSTSEGFVIITPEWGGMVPPGLKNLFLLSSQLELGHKPALLVSVSASINGAYPIAELRSSSYKNNKICYLPEQIIIRSAAEFLKGSEDLHNSKLEQRLDHSLHFLIEYAKAFRLIRESEVYRSGEYPFGM